MCDVPGLRDWEDMTYGGHRSRLTRQGQVLGWQRGSEVEGPGRWQCDLTHVRVGQAVEVILIQVGLFVLRAWGLLGGAGGRGQGGHHVWPLSLPLLFSQGFVWVWFSGQAPVGSQLTHPYL